MAVFSCTALSVVSGVCRDRDSITVAELAFYYLKGALRFLKEKNIRKINVWKYYTNPSQCLALKK